MSEKKYQDREWLVYQIEVLGKSYTQVAKECGVSKNTIAYWYDPSFKDKKKEYSKKYCEENKEKINEYQKKYYEENRESVLKRDKKYREENKEKKKEYYKENKEYISERGRKYFRDIKIKALKILGGCKCVLCDTNDIDCLTVDHIDETGYLDKKKGYSGSTLHSAIVNNTYPKDRLSNLRVLCWNHNIARQRKYLDLPWELQTKRQRWQAKLWKEAFEFFGGCPCRITELKFLQISHIHNDGAERRREGGEGTSTKLLTSFRKLGWPEILKEDYRLECANCNCGKRNAEN